ncbi:MAG: ATP-binding cassette domain-containing protein [Bacteroidaceae bacterium]|nr:ATP-binding cassette domain-containing protein [Bacteroidaceae bacterium]
MGETLIINYQRVDIQRGDNLVLRDVDLQVHPGEFVYITGIVGSGKSSLLKTIYGELDITSGTAEVLGRDMTRIRRRQLPALRKQLGIVFQDFQLLMDRNVRRNLDFVLRATGWKKKAEREARILEVMQRVGLEDKLDKMPYELSGGEQQRVCIARAILNTPRLILADEATGNQDAESGNQTVTILHELAQAGTAVIMVTHNNHLIQQFPATVYECTQQRLLRAEVPGAEGNANAAEGRVPSAEGRVPGGFAAGATLPQADDIPLATISPEEEA